ncbi:PadR family transcriptional regulator [Candidatus Saccharibacteria bacterium]|nr:MAG: PadR family transcriptional regulator [Candidatus Saccharibacteria bacterium]
MTNKNIGNDPEKQQIIRGMLHLAVMTELEKGKRYGAELLISLSKTPFTSRVGTLYPLLNRMEKDGLLDSDWLMEPGQTPRRYYRLTKQGQAKLAEYREFLTYIQTYLGGKP